MFIRDRQTMLTLGENDEYDIEQYCYNRNKKLHRKRLSRPTTRRSNDKENVCPMSSFSALTIDTTKETRSCIYSSATATSKVLPNHSSLSSTSISVSLSSISSTAMYSPQNLGDVLVICFCMLCFTRSSPIWFKYANILWGNSSEKDRHFAQNTKASQ